MRRWVWGCRRDRRCGEKVFRCGGGGRREEGACLGGATAVVGGGEGHRRLGLDLGGELGVESVG